MTAVLTTLKVTPGNGADVAMYQVTETSTGDSVPSTKLLQRVAFNDNAGNDLSGAGGLIFSMIYEATPTPVGSGSFIKLHGTSNGYMIVTSNDVTPGGDSNYQVQGVIPKVTPVSTYSPTIYNKWGVVKESIKGSAGNLTSFQLDSKETSTLFYLQIFDSLAEPTTGAVPKIEIPITLAADSNHPTIITRGAQELSQNGLFVSNGIYWGISSTQGTYTSAGSGGNYHMHAEYY